MLFVFKFTSDYSLLVPYLVRFDPSNAAASSNEYPFNLLSNVDLHAQILSKLPHRGWVLLEPPPDEDNVCLRLVEDFLGDLSVADTT